MASTYVDADRMTSAIDLLVSIPTSGLTMTARRGAPYPVPFCCQQHDPGTQRHTRCVATRVAGLAVRSTLTGSADRPLLAGDGGLMAVLTRRLLLPAASAAVSPGRPLGQALLGRATSLAILGLIQHREWDASDLLTELVGALELREGSDADSPPWAAEREIRRLEHEIVECLRDEAGLDVGDTSGREPPDAGQGTTVIVPAIPAS